MYYFLQEVARSSSLDFCLCNPSCSYKKGNRWQTGGRFAGLFCNSLSIFKPHEKTAKTRKATKLTGPGIDENAGNMMARKIFLFDVIRYSSNDWLPLFASFFICIKERPRAE